MNYKLSAWIVQQLEERNWSIREAARQMGISHTSLNDLINDQMRASTDMCNRLASVFNMPPEFIFRKAGLLPPETESKASFKEALYLFAQLPEELQRTILIQMRALIEEQDNVIQPAARQPVTKSTS